MQRKKTEWVFFSIDDRKKEEKDPETSSVLPGQERMCIPWKMK
jgi:hypothetical protein